LYLEVNIISSTLVAALLSKAQMLVNKLLDEHQSEEQDRSHHICSQLNSHVFKQMVTPVLVRLQLLLEGLNRRLLALVNNECRLRIRITEQLLQEDSKVTFNSLKQRVAIIMASESVQATQLDRKVTNQNTSSCCTAKRGLGAGYAV